jgi:peptidoglycan/LPS O-acetylase OafA/YrhL
MMKRAVIVFVLAAIVLATAGFWFFASKGDLKTIDIAGPGIIIMVVAFAVFVGYRKLNSVKKGEPAEDELSKKVMQKTAALSYYVSLYFWLFMIFIQDKMNLETHSILAIGMLGMAVAFAICWVFFNFRGIKNE